MRDCVKRIVEKSNGAISQKDARDIINSVDGAARRKASEGFDYDQSVKEILSERMQNTKDNILKQKENIARNMVLKKQNADKVAQMIDSGLSVKDAFRAYLEGIESPVEGARDSLDIQKSAVEAAYLGRMIGEINEAGLMKVLNSKTLTDEIGAELWAMSEGKSVTKNKEAKKLADIIHKARESQRVRLNKAGADIGETPGGILPQRHDTYEMTKVGEDKWISDIMPLLDEKRSFGGDYEDLTKALRGAYKAMVTGIRLNDPLINAPKLFQFSGPANLAKKLSQSRQLHFKDYPSWKTWNESYGMKDLNEGIIDSIRQDSQNIALMERLGTNPEAMIGEVVNEIKQKYRDKIIGDDSTDAKIKAMVDGVLEKNMIPGSPKLARIGSNIRAYNNVVMLGKALLSSVTDIPMKALEYKFQGNSWLASNVQPFLDVAYGFKAKKDRVKYASLTGVGMEGMIGDIGARWSAQDTLSNKSAKVQRMYFKLNGLAWWTDTHKQSMGRMMAHHLGLEKDTPFANLDADTKRLFGNYSINEADWDAMRQSVTKHEDGRDYIFPGTIKNEKLAEKLSAYYIDRTNSGVITPSARERRLSTVGTQRGTPIGEAARMVMQFKSFPITVGTKVFGRAMYAKGKMDVPAMGYLLIASMAYGYLAGAMKDLTNGKSPKDPNRLETMYAALAQGGGLGVMGDILLNDSSGMGRSATQVLAGPTFGKLDDIFKIYSAGIRGEGSARQAVMMGINSTPGANLFYVRPALDHIILLQMQEEMNPGYLRRMESNIKRSYGQELLYK